MARRSIEQGLDLQEPGPLSHRDFPESVRQQRASFVTVEVAGELRGCRGTLDAARRLVVDVWHNAYASAFDDPRFPPIDASALEALEIEISVLGPMTQMTARSESELLEQLEAGKDGLLLTCGEQRVTFLPQVWEGLADKREFVRRLKLKAGWHTDFWSPELRCFRYSAESFGTQSSP